MTIRIGVTGSRKYKDRARVYQTLDALLTELKTTDIVLINGVAQGADTLARDWAIGRDLPYEDYRANWAQFGPAAGPIRNQKMKDSHLDILVAFPPGEKPNSGTRGMVKICSTKPKVKRIIKIDWPGNTDGC